MRSDTSIAMLHELLQIAFDWSDFHLHRFLIRGKAYGMSRLGGCMFATDARKVVLSQFRFRADERFLYEYDLGDLWQHQSRFESVEPIEGKKSYPVCIGGACASPPRRLRWEHEKKRIGSNRRSDTADRFRTQSAQAGAAGPPLIAAGEIRACRGMGHRSTIEFSI